ncbi:MAG TPA: hypothetical protein VN948_12090 [Terriglobales bacterium]|nr:hypothetical protein [Terriglobales bacterium]
MRRRIQGLHNADRSAADEVPDGLYLVRVTRAQYRWHAQKPFYILCFAVIEPKESAGHSISGRLYCTPKALWKLSWFLRDFGYDTESLGRDEIDEKNLAGLQGVVKISHAVINGTTLLNLDGFAPTGQWEEVSITPPSKASSEVAR